MDSVSELDPFGMPINPADLEPWPPTSPEELDRLDQWADRQEELLYE